MKIIFDKLLYLKVEKHLKVIQEGVFKGKGLILPTFKEIIKNDEGCFTLMGEKRFFPEVNSYGVYSIEYSKDNNNFFHGNIDCRNAGELGHLYIGYGIDCFVIRYEDKYLALFQYNYD
jgi:hypothetical protein